MANKSLFSSLKSKLPRTTARNEAGRADVWPVARSMPLIIHSTTVLARNQT